MELYRNHAKESETVTKTITKLLIQLLTWSKHDKVQYAASKLLVHGDK